MSRALVIGAGVGGLALSARLAAAGHDVTVLEQADRVGGKLGTYERDGFVFDTGPSLLTMPYVFADLFADTGAPLETVLDLRRVEPACRYRFPDGTWLDLPGRRELVPAALDAALGGGAGAQWAAFLARAEAIWDVTRVPFLESAVTLADMARLSHRTRDVRTVAPWRTLRGLGATYLRDPRLRMLLDRYATYTGSDPRRAPAALATIAYVEQEFGSWYVPGGLRRMGAAMGQRARDRGATIRTGVRVEGIDVDAGRVSGVRLSTGERVSAELVAANVDATQVYRHLLPPGSAPGAVRSLGRTTPSFSGIVLLLALRGRDRSTPHHSVLFTDDYDHEFDSLFGTATHRPRPVHNPTVYVSAPDDPALRPHDDCEAWFVLVNAPRHDPAGGVDWDETGLASDYATHVLEVMAERGVDVRERVEWSHVRTPADLERETGADGGSIYGSSSNGARSAFLRPANRSPVPGLYLVGGSAHPGGGLPLVTLSAQIVADLVRRDAQRS